MSYVPHSASDGWGGDLSCPSPIKSIRHPPLPPWLCLFRAVCPCSCCTPWLCPHPCSPCLHQGGQQGCRQEPFADSEDFLHEWTNLWLILLARGLGSKCGGLRSLLLLWLGEAGGFQ